MSNPRRSWFSGGGLQRNEQITGWLFIMPTLVLIGLFMIYPVIWSLWTSFQVGRGTNLSFGGMDNIYRLLEDPILRRALWNTGIFLVVQVPIMLILALILASSLNAPNLWGRTFFRTAVFLPCITSLVAYSVLFKSMFAEDGVINDFLLWAHLIGEPIPWMLEPFWARIVIIIAVTWRWTGYNMIFYLAALQNIDKSIYEAARIDGVPAYARFWHITVPLLKPVILFTSVISTIGALQLFDEVVNFYPDGSPGDAALTLSVYIYNLTFRFMPNFGYAALVSYVIVILVAVLSYLQFLVARERK